MDPGRVRLSRGIRATAVVFPLLILLLHSRQPLSAGLAADSLPTALSDEEFWSISERMSEPNGFFQSNSGSRDNLLSNEDMLSTVAAELAARTRPAGAYLGVGPEQNFTYIAAIRPKIAFITDIRRGNLHLQLMYKAIFELSPTRADFVGMLFSRKRPLGLSTSSTARDLMEAYSQVEPDEALFEANLKAVSNHLRKTHAFRLDVEDLAGVEYVYRNFYKFGPELNYRSSIGGRPGAAVSYELLMTSRDSARVERSYLASESNFMTVKALQTHNLIVPLVGDFAGPKALRAVGSYLKEHGATVTAFYVSNVEDYLRSDNVMPQFCANVSSMPLDAASVFIRPMTGSRISLMIRDTAACSRR
jgi:hypothetical protein